MPVTAKLSKLFYDRLGEEIADELVDWLNSVDAASRAQLRELNELNYARFEARLDQRLAELEAKLERRIGEQTRWMYVVWAAILASQIGLWIRG
jgi:hypothetical protein